MLTVSTYYHSSSWIGTLNILVLGNETQVTRDLSRTAAFTAYSSAPPPRIMKHTPLHSTSRKRKYEFIPGFQ
jgi:hypothetical protein